MKTIKTNTTLVDYKGQPLKNGGEDATIGNFLTSVLSGQTNNPTLAYQLGKKFALEEEVDLKAEEVVFLKKELENAKGYASIALGQVIQMLD